MRFSLHRPIGPSAHRPISPSAHRPNRLVLSALTLVAFSSFSPAARAQIVLSGSYNNHTNNGGYTGDGYNTTPGQSYIVTPTATFNNNGQWGLFANNSAVTVNGGQFEGNSSFGLLVSGGTTTVNGGTFSGNGDNISVQGNGTLNFYGGSITNSQNEGMFVENGTVNLYGGTFSGNAGYDLLPFAATATITLYGTFSQYGQVTGSSGSFTGTLVDGGGLQTFSYSSQTVDQADVFLVQASSPVPESSSFVSFGLLMALGMSGLVVAARRKKA